MDPNAESLALLREIRDILKENAARQQASIEQQRISVEQQKVAVERQKSAVNLVKVLLLPIALLIGWLVYRIAAH